jgi:hypothetical protein
MIKNSLYYFLIVFLLTSCPTWVRKSDPAPKNDSPLSSIDGAIGGSASNWNGKSIADSINRRTDPPNMSSSRNDNCPSTGTTCDEAEQIKTCSQSSPSSSCQKIVEVPREGEGFKSYHPRKWSYLKKYVSESVRYAAASVKCSMGGDSSVGPLGFGDMSEADGGGITHRHPGDSHANGKAIDIAYYLKRPVDGGGNYLQPVCDHHIRGEDQHHCVKPPHNIDYKRTAIMVGKLLESPKLRVIGVDGKIIDGLKKEMKKQCSRGGKLAGSKGCNNIHKITAEKTNTGMGWFHHHHHHLHASYY